VTNSLYRAAGTPQLVRIYIAGYRAPDGHWDGWVEDLDNPVNKGVTVAANAWIKDQSVATSILDETLNYARYNPT